MNESKDVKVKIAAFDIGIHNLPVVVEEFNLTQLQHLSSQIPKQKYQKSGLPTLEFSKLLNKVYQNGKVLFQCKGNFLKEKLDSQTSHPLTLNKISTWIRELSILYDCDIILIELQLKINNVAKQIEQHIRTVMSEMLKDQIQSGKTQILLYPANLKTKILGAHKLEIKKPKCRKEWACKMLKNILLSRNEFHTYESVIRGNPKYDDESDSLLMIQSAKYKLFLDTSVPVPKKGKNGKIKKPQTLNIAPIQPGETLKNVESLYVCEFGHQQVNRSYTRRECDVCNYQRGTLFMNVQVNPLIQGKGKCLTQEYMNMTDSRKLEFKCRYNHIFWLSYDQLQTGLWCPVCMCRSNMERVCKYIFDQLLSVKFLPSKLNPHKYMNKQLKLNFELSGYQDYINYYQENTFDPILLHSENKESKNTIHIPYTLPFSCVQKFIEHKCEEMKIPIPDTNKSINIVYVCDKFDIDTKLNEMKELVYPLGGTCLSLTSHADRLLFKCQHHRVFEKSCIQIKRNIQQNKEWCENHEVDCLICNFVMKSGKNKGNECGKPVCKNTRHGMCSVHEKKIVSDTHKNILLLY